MPTVWPSALRRGKRPEFRMAELLAFLKRLDDAREHRIDGLRGVALADIGGRCDLSDEIVFIHGGCPFFVSDGSSRRVPPGHAEAPIACSVRRHARQTRQAQQRHLFAFFVVPAGLSDAEPRPGRRPPEAEEPGSGSRPSTRSVARVSPGREAAPRRLSKPV